MSPVYKNIVANYLGNFITAILAFLFVPVYVHFLGVGTFGIIGFFATLQVLFSFLDMGIGMAINREMARHYHDESKAAYLRNLTHTLQIVYWSIGLVIGAILLLSSSFLSANWFKETDIPQHTILVAFFILSITIAFRWPYSLYSSGLRGMQHQVALNVHDLFWNLTKTIGSWVVIKYIDNSLPAFLWFQCSVTVLQTVGTMLMLWYYMPKDSEKRKIVFDKKILKGIGRYAAGMGVAVILIQVMGQMDKVIVSKMVSDTQFGYYIIAGNVAILVNTLSYPLYMGILPHFTKLFFENRKEEIKKDYHFYTRLLYCLVLPFSIVIFFYSKEFLWLWTKNSQLADSISPILRLMIAGTTLNAMVVPIQTLLLAANKVRFILYSNIAAFILAIPVIMFLTIRFGVTGGAISVLVLFGGFFLIQAPLIFRVLRMQDGLIRWYLKDVLFFAIPLVAISLGLAQFNSRIITTDRWQLFWNLAAITVSFYGITFLMNKRLRYLIGNLFKKLRRGSLT